jgi:hypothetical protein
LQFEKIPASEWHKNLKQLSVTLYFYHIILKVEWSPQRDKKKVKMKIGNSYFKYYCRLLYYEFKLITLNSKAKIVLKIQI